MADREVNNTSAVIADGIFRAVERVAVRLFIGWLIYIIILGLSGRLDRDDSDGVKRSGLRLHTDALTGCQYFSSQGGGVAPRMGADGRQVCNAAKAGMEMP